MIHMCIPIADDFFRQGGSIIWGEFLWRRTEPGRRPLLTSGGVLKCGGDCAGVGGAVVVVVEVATST